MPKELTHWILAERALAGLDDDSRLRELIQNHHDCYLGGAILPDTLLHHFRGPHSSVALTLAKRFHDTAGNSFAPLIRAEQRTPEGLPQATLACLLGVITHMQADIVFHPFVYALAGTTESGRHFRIETDMDIYFLKSGTGPNIKLVANLISPATRLTLIDTCALLFDPDSLLPRKELERALRLHSHFQGLYDRSFWKLAVNLAALLAGTPYREQRHLFYPLTSRHNTSFAEETVEWRHPFSGELRRTSLDLLADETVQRTTALFKCIDSAGSLADVLTCSPGENLLTGIHGACLAATETNGA